MKKDNAVVLTADHEQLRQAFTVFSQASTQLSGVYQALQQQVSRLNEELALANGELQRELTAKETLSRQLSQLLTALPAGVIALDNDNCINRVNPAAVRLLGEPLLGMPWQQVAGARLRPTNAPNEWHIGGGEVSSLRRVFIESSTSGKTRERILLIHDITEAHAMQEQNLRNQRLAAMGEMAAGLAHQLRTPLSTALLYAGHLSNETLSTQERKSFAVKTIDRLHQLEQLIRNMLRFVKGESIPIDEVKLSTLLDELQRAMAPQIQQHNLRLSVRDNSNGISLNVSQEALRSAVTNLLDNAIQASPAGGLITLACETAEDEVRISVSDNGPGIDVVLQERLFEPFFTTRTEGTGLGLAIVHNVIQSMKGEIGIDSTPGVGSRFMVKLPRMTKASHAKHLLPDLAEVSSNKEY